MPVSVDRSSLSRLPTEPRLKLSRHASSQDCECIRRFLPSCRRLALISARSGGFAHSSRKSFEGNQSAFTYALKLESGLSKVQLRYERAKLTVILPAEIATR